MADHIKVVIDGDSADLRHAVLLAEHSIRDLSREVAKQNAQQRSYAAGSREIEQALSRVERQVRKTDSSHQRLGRTLATVGWSSLASGIGPAASALTSAAAGAIALTSALGPMTGALAAVPAAGAAAAQALGVGALAFYGIADAVKAVEAQHKQAGTAATNSANQQRDAAQRVTQASEQVSTAKRDERDAELQLHDARRQAIRDLQDLENQSKDSELAEKRANLTLKDAIKALRDAELSPTATSRDLQDARLTVAEARRSLSEAKQSHTRANADLQRAHVEGVEKMPVVAAAHRQVEDAKRSEEDATRALTAAEQDQTDALTKQSAAATDLQQKMAALSPAGRAFVRELESLKPAAEHLRNLAQEGLFPGLTRGLDAATHNLPVFNTIVKDTAGELGKLAEQAGKALGSERWGKDLAFLGGQNVHLIDDFGQSVGHVASALDNVTVAAAPLTKWMADSVTGWTANLDKWTEAKRKSGELADFFDETKHVLSTVADIGSNAAQLLFHIGEAAAPLGKIELGGLDHLLRSLSDWSQSAGGKQQLGDFFHAAQAPLEAVAHLAGHLLVDLLKLGEDGAPALAEVARILDEDLLPPLDDLATAITKDLLPHLLPAADALVNLFAKLEPGIKAALGPIGIVLDDLKHLTDAIGFVSGHLPGILKVLPVIAAGLGGKALFARTVDNVKGIGTAWKGVESQAKAARVAQERAAKAPAGGAASGGGPAVIAGGSPRERAGRAFGSFAGKVPLAALGVARAAAPIVIINAAINAPEAAGKIGSGGNVLEAVRGWLNKSSFGALPKPSGAGKFTNPLFQTGLTDSGAAKPPTSEQVSALRRMEDYLIRNRNHADRLAGAIKAVGKSDFFTDQQKADFKKFGTNVGSLTDNFARMKNGSVLSVKELEQNVSQNMQAIALEMQHHSKRGTQDLITNTKLAVKGIKGFMDDGTLTTAQGMKKMQQLFEAEMALFGVSGNQAHHDAFARAYSLATGKDSSVVNTRHGNQRGGLHQFGSPGERGKDSIPVDFGASKIMVAPGEQGAVFTGEQQRVVNEALMEAKGIPGLPGLFRAHSTPHERTGYAKGGIARAVADVEQRFPGLSVTSTTDHPYLTTSGNVSDHTRGWAADVSGAPALMFQAAEWIKRSGMARSLKQGIHNPNLAVDHGRNVGAGFFGPAVWAQHASHIHLAVEGALGKVLGGVLGGLGGVGDALGPQYKAIKRLIVEGPDSPMKAILQGSLDKTRKAANARLRQLAGQAGGAGAGTASFGPASGSWMGELHKIAGQRGWSVSDWLNIIRPESGGNPNARNGQYYGLGQLSADAQRTYGGGPGSSPAEEIDAMARYIVGHGYGNPTKALDFRRGHNWYAQGGLVGAAAKAAGGVGRFDHLFRRHNLGQSRPGDSIGRGATEMIARWAGLPGHAFGNIAWGESMFEPGIIGHDHNAIHSLGYGLFQNTTKVNGSAFEHVIERLGGWGQQLNPLRNALASKWLYDHGGLSHWRGTAHGTGGGGKTHPAPAYRGKGGKGFRGQGPGTGRRRAGAPRRDRRLANLRIPHLGDYFGDAIAGQERRIGRDEGQRPHLEALLAAVRDDPAHPIPDEIAALRNVIANREDVLSALMTEERLARFGLTQEDGQIETDEAIFGRLVKEVRRNDRRLGTTATELKALQRKGKLTPSEQRRKASLIAERADIAKGQLLLTGSTAPDPHGLTALADQSPKTPLGRAWHELGAEKGRRKNLADLLRTSDTGSLPYTIQAARDELYLGPNSLTRQLSDLTGETTPVGAKADDSALLGLRTQQLTDALSNLRLSESELSVFQGFRPAGLVGGLGGFARGVQAIPRDGYALLHEGETVLPSAEGPYGHQVRPYPAQIPVQAQGGGQQPVIINLYGDAAAIVQRAVSESRDQTVQIVRQTGRDARQLANAPGRF